MVLGPREQALILHADECLDHDPGEGHPENAERVRAVEDSLEARPIAGTRRAHARRATRKELERIHDAAHVDRIERSARNILGKLRGCGSRRRRSAR